MANYGGGKSGLRNNKGANRRVEVSEGEKIRGIQGRGKY